MKSEISFNGKHGEINVYYDADYPPFVHMWLRYSLPSAGYLELGIKGYFYSDGGFRIEGIEENEPPILEKFFSHEQGENSLTITEGYEVEFDRRQLVNSILGTVAEIWKTPEIDSHEIDKKIVDTLTREVEKAKKNLIYKEYSIFVRGEKESYRFEIYESGNYTVRRCANKMDRTEAEVEGTVENPERFINVIREVFDEKGNIVSVKEWLEKNFEPQNVRDFELYIGSRITNVPKEFVVDVIKGNVPITEVSKRLEERDNKRKRR